MSETMTLTIKLSPETREFIRSRVESGEFTSESEVVLEGIETLRAKTEARERWEQEVLIPTHDRMMANPSLALSREQLLTSLEEARRLRRKAS